jgi:LPXTG-motif cell wall-anchored protein
VLSAVNFIVFIGILSSGLFSNYLNANWKPTMAFGIMGLASLGVTVLLFFLFRKQNEKIGG